MDDNQTQKLKPMILIPGIYPGFIKHRHLFKSAKLYGNGLVAALKNDYQYFKEYSLMINMTGDFDFTPLHVAVMANNPSMVVFLLHLGADINAANRDGNTALHFAYIIKNEAIKRFLINMGADRNKENNAGLKPDDFID